MMSKLWSYTPYQRLFQMLTICFILFVTACCAKNIPPPDNQIKDPFILRAAIDGRLDEIRSARFKNIVLDYYGKQRLKVRQLILVSSPNQLRIQTKAPGTDEILSLLVSDGQQFAMHERDSNTYYAGKPTRKNINQLMPLDFSAEDIVRIMLAGAPWDRLLAYNAPVKLEWNRRTGKYRLSAQHPENKSIFSIEVRHTDFAVVSFDEQNADGKIIYEYQTDDWKYFDNTVLPSFRRFVWHSKDVDFSLDIGNTELNIECPDFLFQLPAPPGSQIIKMN